MLASFPKSFNVSSPFDLLGFLSLLCTLEVLPASVEKNVFSSFHFLRKTRTMCVCIIYNNYFIAEDIQILYISSFLNTWFQKREKLKTLRPTKFSYMIIFTITINL